MVSGLELLVDGLDFGEGPRWHDGRLWYSDFYQHKIYAVSHGGARETILDLGSEQPSGLGWMPDGSLLVLAMSARQVLCLDDGELTVHADLSDIATWHCNDMVVAADGTAYVGNFGWDIEHDRGLPQAATLAVVRPDGSVQPGPGDLLFPNGSVITPDGTTLIVGETFGARFTAFDLHPDGRPGNRREWAAVPGTAPDGCTLDSAGGIWFADAGMPICKMSLADRTNFAQPGQNDVIRCSRKCRIHSAPTSVKRRANNVAHAAPAISMRGAPNRPKIRIGSSMALRIADPNIIKPGHLASPQARIALLPVIGTTRKTIPIYHGTM